MEILLKLSLYLHIASGVLALVAAPVAIALRNKPAIHRIPGRVYFYSMLAVTATALFIAIIKGNIFLLMVGIFSFYSIWNARRALAQKQLHNGQKPKWYDYLVDAAVFITNAGMLVLGVILLGRGNAMGWVAIVFAMIGIATIARTVRLYLVKPKDPQFWLYRHLQGMMAGYIATVTAFLSVNNRWLPDLAVWLGPTVIGSAVITYFMIQLKKRAAVQVP